MAPSWEASSSQTPLSVSVGSRLPALKASNHTWKEHPCTAENPVTCHLHRLPMLCVSVFYHEAVKKVKS